MAKPKGTSSQAMPSMPNAPSGPDYIVFGNGTEKEDAHELTEADQETP